MDRRIGIQQRAAREDARAALGTCRGESCHQRTGDDFVPGAANRCHTGGQIQRQNLVAGHMRESEHVHDMHVGVDQSRQGKLPAAIDARRVGG